MDRQQFLLCGHLISLWTSYFPNGTFVFAMWTFVFPISIVRIFDFSMDTLCTYSDGYFAKRTFDFPLGHFNYLSDIWSDSADI